MSLGGACAGETPRGPRLGGLGRWGGPGRARRIQTPPGALVLGHEHLAARCDPRRGLQATQARRGVGMPLFTGSAAAADAPAETSAPRAQWCPMLQAERALSAATGARQATALRSGERNTLGRRLLGPPGVWQERRPPLEGAEEVVNEKEVAQWRRHAGRRPQAPDPGVLAVTRQAHKLQHHPLRVPRKTDGLLGRRTRRLPRGEGSTPPPKGRRERHRPKGAPHSSVPATRWRSTSAAALRTIGARSPSGRHVGRRR